MTYSLTERKRIRKSFAKRAIVQKVPFLIATQLESYTGVPAGARRARERAGTRGCRRRSPRSSRSPATPGNARLEFVSYSLGEPPFDVKECQQRGLTYASPLRAKVRLVILDKDAPKPTTKEVKEQEVYMGEIPLMTTTGSFIINGTERVIVSPAAPLARACSSSTTAARRTRSRQAALLGARHSVPRLLARLRVRPEGHRVLPRRPPPQDAGDHPAEGARLHARAHPQGILRLRHLPHRDGPASLFEVVPERLRGEVARFDINDKSRQDHRRQGQAHHGQAHPRHGGRGHQAHQRAGRLHPRPHARAQRGRRRTPARSSPTPTTRSPRRCSPSCASRRSARSRRCSPTTSTRARTSRRRCAPTRPPTCRPRASRSTA